MEDVMSLASPYDDKTGLPKDKSYLEHGLPVFLLESVRQMDAVWKNSTTVKSICVGTAITVICKVTSIPQKQTGRLAQNRLGICARSI